MSFQDLFELALLNSREYQREKESLYEAALTLSLERFAYATKFTVRGTTVDTTYTHQSSRRRHGQYVGGSQCLQRRQAAGDQWYLGRASLPTMWC